MPSESRRWGPARSLSRQDIPERAIERFHSQYARSGDCWNWSGRTDRAGYGVISVGQTSLLAHRMAYAISNGPIAAGQYVLHACDNRLCVRPEHLSLGTHADNMEDKYARGRQHRPVGRANGRAVLDQGIVDQLRETYHSLPRGAKRAFRWAEAERLGVTERNIRAVLCGETWIVSAGAEAVRKAIGV